MMRFFQMETKFIQIKWIKMMVILTTIIVIIAGCSNHVVNEDKKSAAISEIDQAAEDAAQGHKELEFSTLPDPQQDAGVEGMKVVLGNTNYALLMDPVTTDIAVLDKNTQNVFHSNPARGDSTIKVNEEVLSAISSALMIQAFDISGRKIEFATLKDSVAYTQFKVHSINNGVRIVYKIGKDEGKRLIPPVLTPETYASIHDKISKSSQKNLEAGYKLISPENLSDDIKEKYLKDYPEIEKMSLYVLRDLNKRLQKLVEDTMVEAEFTVDDMMKERETAGYQGASKSLTFVVPLDIIMDDKGLVASVDCNLIKGPDNFKLSKISLFRGFGGVAQKEGYMMVPDGSGALLPLVGGSSNEVYSQRVYGYDQTFAKHKISILASQSIMPVFGLKSHDSAVFGIIEDGAALAGIVARPMNTVNPMASVNAEFFITETDYRDYTGIMRQPQGILLSKEGYRGICSIRYAFLGGKNNDYSSMASFYRKYLIERGVLNKLNSRETPFYLNLYGAVDKKKSITGIPVNYKQTLTTYAQTQEILKELLGKGVKNIHVKYLGWANGGMNHTVMDHVKLLRELGGKSEFKKLIDFIHQRDIGFYPEADMNYVFEDKLFDSFEYKRDASRRLDMRAAVIGDYNNSTFEMYRNIKRKFIISPDKMPQIAESFIKSFDGYATGGGVFLGKIGESLNSNYKKDHIIDRDESESYYNEVLKLFKEQGYPLMVDQGNAYTWAYADHITNLPIGSSEFVYATESIPFCQMVLHGYVDYTGIPFNSTSDMKMELLKAIETGSGIHFRMMYSPNTALKKTEYENYYSMYYKDWIDEAAQVYKEAAEALNKLQDSEIIHHQKIQHHVYATTYSNGMQVIVNYSNKDADVQGKVVKAMGYSLVEVQR